jgi:hypothetical protein
LGLAFNGKFFATPRRQTPFDPEPLLTRWTDAQRDPELLTVPPAKAACSVLGRDTGVRGV